ncbi:MAG: hypothetical protein IMZ62_15270 [Chloroflexi bacterium]|nr:hypothetical protein [Chloroflexota bacterium]
MLIGYAQTIITPSLARPVYMAGFAQNRQATAIHDDLYVRALAMCTRERTIVFCALDLIGFFRPDVQDVIQRVRGHFTELTKPEILIASLHPHDGPDTMGLWGPDDRTSGVDPLYLAELKDKTVATILTALAAAIKESPSLKSVCLRVPGLAKNARNPEILDDELTALQFLDIDGRPLVSLFDFACHPEVMWEHNTQISADYVGYLRQAVEETTGAPCIFFSGALGGMMTPDVKEHSFAEAESIGQTLAKSGLEALENASSFPVQELDVQKKEIKVKLTNILYKFAFRRKLLPDVRDRQGRITSEVCLVRIGAAWFAAIPGELLPKLGLALKGEMKAAGAQVPGVICLANDELGYILPAEDFRFPLNPFKPGKHYEETNSISKEMGPVVMEAMLNLLR